MAIPVWLCWQIRISLRQKLGLYSLLCLGVIIIVFSIVRILVTNTDGLHPEPSWLATWSAVESSVAVIVACLSSFKAVLSQRSRQTAGSTSKGRYYQNHGQGTDRRSERVSEGCASRSGHQSEEEHEMSRYPSRRKPASNSAGVEGNKPGMSEESIELPGLRQVSFESQTRILREQ